MSLTARAERQRVDVKRILCGPASLLLPADVRLLLQEQADILSGLAAEVAALQKGEGHGKE